MGKENHITGLTLPRNQDNDETDLEVAEIVGEQLQQVQQVDHKKEQYHQIISSMHQTNQ